MSFAGSVDDAGSAPIGLDDPLRRLRAAVDALCTLEPGEMPDARLAGDVLSARREMDRLEAVTAEWCLAAERRGIGMEDGYASTRAWLAWQTGRPRGDINRVLATARTVELLPDTQAAWRDGDITTAAVDSIASARVEGHDDALVACEPELLAFARRRDHRSLRRLTAHFRACALADGSKPGPADGFTLARVGERTVVRGELHADAAETLTHAINTFTLAPDPQSSATPAERRAAALVRVCEVALARGGDGSPARPAVSYVTQARTGDDRPLTSGQFTGVIAPGDRDRLLCDCDRTDITVDDTGVVLDVGRATRTWPRAIRAAIIVRDGTCRWPGCEVPSGWCDTHHHTHWEQSGATSLDNGLLLCRAHHTFLHRHPDWTTTFFEQVFRVYRPDGRELDPDPWKARSIDHVYDTAV